MPGMDAGRKAVQPLWTPPATPAGCTATVVMTKQHLGCPILQLHPGKQVRSFRRVSHSCSEFVHPLRAGPCSHAMPGDPRREGHGDAVALGSWLLAHQTAVDCLMLWKLTRVGEVGMDMARATRARMECLSCHRCHRFRTADRTWR